MKPKLAVCTPWSSPFMYSAYVEAQLNLQHPEGWTVRHVIGKGWCPARRHADMCEKALAWGADVICITGADQVHPEDMLVRLLARMQEGYEVIAALVPSRGYVGWQDMQPFQRMAWRIKRSGPLSIEDANALLHTPNDIEAIDPDAGEVQEINFIGSGVTMFPAEILHRLKMPWFAETYNPQTMQRLASMDTTWVWRLQAECGARVWVDCSIPVEHLNIFPIDPSYSARFSDWALPGAGDPAICRYAPASAPAEGTDAG